MENCYLVFQCQDVVVEPESSHADSIELGFGCSSCEMGRLCTSMLTLMELLVRQRGVLFSKAVVRAMELLTGHNRVEQVLQVGPRKSYQRMALQQVCVKPRRIRWAVENVWGSRISPNAEYICRDDVRVDERRDHPIRSELTNRVPGVVPQQRLGPNPKIERASRMGGLNPMTA